MTLYSFLLLVHLVGLALGVGAATVKLRLLFRCKADSSFVPVYLKVTKPITQTLILGLVLATVSGFGWLVGKWFGFTPMLIVKIVLVAGLWIVGPLIDNVLEPRFRNLAPAPGEAPTPEFATARDRLIAVEAAATGLFYVVTVLGLLLTA